MKIFYSVSALFVGLTSVLGDGIPAIPVLPTEPTGPEVPVDPCEECMPCIDAAYWQVYGYSAYPYMIFRGEDQGEIRGEAVPIIGDKNPGVPILCLDDMPACTDRVECFLPSECLACPLPDPLWKANLQSPGACKVTDPDGGQDGPLVCISNIKEGGGYDQSHCSYTLTREAEVFSTNFELMTKDQVEVVPGFFGEIRPLPEGENWLVIEKPKQPRTMVFTGVQSSYPKISNYFFEGTDFNFNAFGDSPGLDGFRICAIGGPGLPFPEFEFTSSDAAIVRIQQGSSCSVDGNCIVPGPQNEFNGKGWCQFEVLIDYAVVVVDSDITTNRAQIIFRKPSGVISDVFGAKAKGVQTSYDAGEYLTNARLGDQISFTNYASTSYIRGRICLFDN